MLRAYARTGVDPTATTGEGGQTPSSPRREDTARGRPHYGKIRNKIVEVVKDAMAQKVSPKEALADAAAFSNALLAG